MHLHPAPQDVVDQGCTQLVVWAAEGSPTSAPGGGSPSGPVTRTGPIMSPSDASDLVLVALSSACEQWLRLVGLNEGCGLHVAPQLLHTEASKYAWWIGGADL